MGKSAAVYLLCLYGAPDNNKRMFLYIFTNDGKGNFFLIGTCNEKKFNSNTAISFTRVLCCIIDIALYITQQSFEAILYVLVFLMTI